MKFMRVLASLLEEQTGIKIKSENKRYKNGLFKYIDDNFSIFKPLLDSFYFPLIIDIEKERKL
jgi:hypothetical protein